MNLTAANLFLKEHEGTGCSENIAFRCEVSQRLEEAGDYAGAGEVLGVRWKGAGVRPDLCGLTKKDAALLLLRAGMLSHRIAVTDARPGVQDEAKDLLDEAARMFAELRDLKREGEALLGVGLCYWRQAALDEALLILADVKARAAKSDGALMAATLLARGCVEWSAGNWRKALRLYLECAPWAEQYGSHRLQAGLHCAMALSRRRDGNLDAALIEDTAASYHLEQAGDIRQSAALENNIGYHLAAAGRYAEAHEHYDRAWQLFTQWGDSVQAAKVDESRAQSLLAERKPADAEPFAARAAAALAEADDKVTLVESLLTLGTARAHCGNGPAAWEVFERAREIAHNYIGLAEAEKVLRVMLDELGPVLYSAPGMRYFDAKWALQRALIKKALADSNWNVTQAAFNLGMKASGLQQLLKGTHRDVWDERPASKS